MQMHIEAFFNPPTSTFSYVVFAGPGQPCAIIDSVLGFDPVSGRTDTGPAQRILDFVTAQQLKVTWHLETHAHADHLSAAAWLKARVGGDIAISRHITTVQQTFLHTFDLGHELTPDGSQFDVLFNDDEEFSIGPIRARALHVPGHTPADLAYCLNDEAIFVGDTLFMPDVGSARCDFPGGNAATLFRSVQRLLAFPPDTRLYMCHDYPPPGREPTYLTSVAAQRAANIHLRHPTDEASFVAMREARDATLDLPRLIIPSLQVNLRAGHLPPAAANGVRYLKVPIDVL